eukprot:353366-Lingulodinium_polyedra.AAC.1
MRCIGHNPTAVAAAILGFEDLTDCAVSGSSKPWRSAELLFRMLRSARMHSAIVACYDATTIRRPLVLNSA